MEDDDQDRGDEEIRQEVQTHEQEEEVKARRQNKRTDMWTRMFSKTRPEST